MRELLRLLDRGGLHIRRSLLRLSALSLLSVAFEAIAMYAAVNIFGTLFEDSGEQVRLAGRDISLISACLVGLGAAGVSAVADFCVGRQTSALSVTYLTLLRSDIARGTSHAATEVQREFGGGRVQELLTSVAYQASLLPMRAATMVAAGSSSLALVSIAFVVAPVAAAALVVAGALLMTLMRPIGRRTSRAADAHTREQSALAVETAAWAARFTAARTYGVDTPSTERMVGQIGRTSSELFSLRSLAFSGIVAYRTATIAMLMVLVTAAASASLVEALDAALVLVVVVRALSYSQQFNAARQIAFEAVGPARELVRVGEQLAAARRAAGSVRLSGTPELRMRGLRLDLGDEAVLDRVEVEIRPGDRVAIVGQSGAGKSVLLDALVGLRQPTEGEVLVDGTRLPEIDPDDWARGVAYVAQDTCIIDGDLVDNVRFFRSEVSTESALASLQQVGLVSDALVDRRSVGGTSSGLSGGQAQRVGLARALAGRPSVLLLDEPTSALDAVSEQLVVDALAGCPDDVTIVLVTHRPGPLAACERFYAVREGSVTELPDRTAALQFCQEPDSDAAAR